VLDHGKVQAIGNHEELTRNDPLYARLAALQFSDNAGEVDAGSSPA
jgi:ATP-binding cassette subfamily B protein